jgi:hypothetical protein
MRTGNLNQFNKALLGGIANSIPWAAFQEANWENPKGQSHLGGVVLFPVSDQEYEL